MAEIVTRVADTAVGAQPSGLSADSVRWLQEHIFDDFSDSAVFCDKDGRPQWLLVLHEDNEIEVIDL